MLAECYPLKDMVYIFLKRNTIAFVLLIFKNMCRRTYTSMTVIFSWQMWAQECLGSNHWLYGSSSCVAMYSMILTLTNVITLLD